MDKREILDNLPDCRASSFELRKDRVHGFTPRERTMLDLLQQRLPNKEIASKLAISERTVRFYLRNVFAKLGVHDRYSAADSAKSGSLLQNS